MENNINIDLGGQRDEYETQLMIATAEKVGKQERKQGSGVGDFGDNSFHAELEAIFERNTKEIVSLITSKLNISYDEFIKLDLYKSGLEIFENERSFITWLTKKQYGGKQLIELIIIGRSDLVLQVLGRMECGATA